MDFAPLNLAPRERCATGSMDSSSKGRSEQPLVLLTSTKKTRRSSSASDWLLSMTSWSWSQQLKLLTWSNQRSATYLGHSPKPKVKAMLRSKNGEKVIGDSGATKQSTSLMSCPSSSCTSNLSTLPLQRRQRKY